MHRLAHASVYSVRLPLLRWPHKRTQAIERDTHTVAALRSFTERTVFGNFDFGCAYRFSSSFSLSQPRSMGFLPNLFKNVNDPLPESYEASVNLTGIQANHALKAAKKHIYKGAG